MFETLEYHIRFFGIESKFCLKTRWISYIRTSILKLNIAASALMCIETQFREHSKKVVRRNKKLPGRHKWTKLRRELVRRSRRWWTFDNCLQKLIETRPCLLIFRLYIRKPPYGTFEYYHPQTPDVTAIIISTATDSFWLQKGNQQTNTLSIITFSIWLWMQEIKGEWRHKLDRMRCYAVSGKNIVTKESDKKCKNNMWKEVTLDK